MVPTNPLDTTVDPVALLDVTLEQTWHVLCEAYDVSSEMPGQPALFAYADLRTPPKAAETVLANMLLDVMEHVGRFSPWYKMPARAFGLISVSDFKTGQPRWLLAAEAVQRWQMALEALSVAIRKNNGLLQATLLVETLAIDEMLDDPCVSVQCECNPPRRIRLSQSVLNKTAIICDACHQPFS